MVRPDLADWAVMSAALGLILIMALMAMSAVRAERWRQDPGREWSWPENDNEETMMNDQTHVASTSDERTANNTLRHTYRVLSDEEKARMAAIKDKGQELLDLIAEAGNSRELSIARTKTEEAVMWAVKHVTA